MSNFEMVTLGFLFVRHAIPKMKCGLFWLNIESTEET